MPTPLEGRGWSKAPLDVAHAGQWLRGLLKVSAEGVNRVATHSCKCTTLSMMAKYGTDSFSRRCLGYHTHGKDQSLLIYSRDSMSSPLRKLTEVIMAIREKKFDPDTSRSGFFMGADATASGSGGVQLDDAASDSSDSHGSQSEEDGEPDEDEKAASKVVGEWKPQHVNDECLFARHRVSRCIHVIEDESGTSTKCGRTLSTRYIRLMSRPEFLHPICSVCFRS